MAKSMRCKREKRLKSIKRERVEKQPFYTNTETAKLAVQAASLASPKLPVFSTNTNTNIMNVDMGEGDRMEQFLKPSSRKIGKSMKKKIKIAKKKNHGKGKILRKNM